MSVTYPTSLSVLSVGVSTLHGFVMVKRIVLIEAMKLTVLIALQMSINAPTETAFLKIIAVIISMTAKTTAMK